MSELTNLIMFCEGVKTRLLHSSQKAELDNLMDRVQMERNDLLTDRKALVRYIRAEDALANLKKISGVMDLAKEAKEAYEALSQELRDEISKESSDEAEIQ